jgi:hypothetical protein
MVGRIERIELDLTRQVTIEALQRERWEIEQRLQQALADIQFVNQREQVSQNVISDLREKLAESESASAQHDLQQLRDELLQTRSNLQQALADLNNVRLCGVQQERATHDLVTGLRKKCVELESIENRIRIPDVDQSFSNCFDIESAIVVVKLKRHRSDLLFMVSAHSTCHMSL